jgi:hypothetical protein
LIGKFVEAEICENPAFTVADGLIGLSQVPKRNSVVRKLLIVKSRGQASVPGLHTFRITDDGLHTYSRTYSRTLGLLDRRPPSRAALGFPPGKCRNRQNHGRRHRTRRLSAGDGGCRDGKIGFRDPLHQRRTAAWSLESWWCSRNALKTLCGERRISGGAWQRRSGKSN